MLETSLLMLLHMIVTSYHHQQLIYRKRLWSTPLSVIGQALLSPNCAKHLSVHLWMCRLYVQRTWVGLLVSFYIHLVAMSESPEVCQFSSTEAISTHCCNASASNWVQRFLRCLGTFALTNFVKMSALVKNACTFFVIFHPFSVYFWGNNRLCTPAHNDFQYSTMNNYICIPDWLPKGTVQVFDCNFDPTPAEMLLFTTGKRRFLSVYQA